VSRKSNNDELTLAKARGSSATKPYTTVLEVVANTPEGKKLQRLRNEKSKKQLNHANKLSLKESSLCTASKDEGAAH